jgi:hypothetical protein
LLEQVFITCMIHSQQTDKVYGFKLWWHSFWYLYLLSEWT